MKEKKTKNNKSSGLDSVRLEPKARVEPRVFGRGFARLNSGQKKLEPRF